MNPLYLYLNLNWAIYMFEVQNKYNTAIEELEILLANFYENGNLFKLNR